MSKLLRRAKTKLDNAISSYGKIASDDVYLDDCCFNLQQGIEFVLKYMVEMTGQRYAQNHDIRAQLNLLDKAGVKYRHKIDLRNMAVTINEWKDAARYNDSFVAVVEDVELALVILKDLIVDAGL